MCGWIRGGRKRKMRTEDKVLERFERGMGAFIMMVGVGVLLIFIKGFFAPEAFLTELLEKLITSSQVGNIAVTLIGVGCGGLITFLGIVLALNKL